MPILMAMELSPVLLQFIGSLLAINLLAGIAHLLKLGPAPKLASEQDAREIADQVHAGFKPVDISIDQEGNGALLRSASGQIMLVRPHGSHFAGRILPNNARLNVSQDGLVIDSAEKRFGTMRLRIQQPQKWMKAWEESTIDSGETANA